MEHHSRMFFDEGASRRGIEKAKKAFINKKSKYLVNNNYSDLALLTVIIVTH